MFSMWRIRREAVKDGMLHEFPDMVLPDDETLDALIRHIEDYCNTKSSVYLTEIGIDLIKLYKEIGVKNSPMIKNYKKNISDHMGMSEEKLGRSEAFWKYVEKILGVR